MGETLGATPLLTEMQPGQRPGRGAQLCDPGQDVTPLRASTDQKVSEVPSNVGIVEPPTRTVQAGYEPAWVLGSQKHKEALLGISGHHVHPSPSNRLPV